MTPDLRDYARLLLRHEPTHSLPLGVLHERLRQVAGRAGRAHGNWSTRSAPMRRSGCFGRRP